MCEEKRERKRGRRQLLFKPMKISKRKYERRPDEMKRRKKEKMSWSSRKEIDNK